MDKIYIDNRLYLYNYNQDRQGGGCMTRVEERKLVEEENQKILTYAEHLKKIVESEGEELFLKNCKCHNGKKAHHPVTGPLFISMFQGNFKK